MTTKDSSLYGIPRPKKASGKEISSSTTLAFTSQLSTLIASSTSTTNRSSTGRARPKKDDIFATHNKGSRKRALKDLDDVCFEQKHSTSSDALDAATYHRSKRKMEEKARLYAAMKRGDVEDVDEKYAVDFDRKWAEQQGRGEGSDAETSSGDEDSEAENEVVEYTDEFGRTRRGTKAEAAREERRKKAAAADEPDRFTARPAAPSNIIYGDTVQAAAFNPDVTIAEQMAALAAKRDKEVTPPPDEHFDGSKEIRTKGTGFYQFSADKEMRAREMEALEKERAETERAREERDRRKEERKREVEEKRKAIKEKRGKVQADRFLDSLGDALG
ncbi:hypothetical protein H2201_001798 [Coniosporium apollinis]|uniref:Nuclear speckle splicing regulatory protein 1 N-terminal domain-containing protein n=1 Tax=Coniosporium apollinis TaxID=61459 RepID=A0ABQ9P161_9PEZI|nr:hypothetical protein H2201_001798 [Coniosporium apollinis]